LFLAMAATVTQDEKLMMFLETCGQSTSIEVAQQLLARHDWNVEAAVNEMFTDPPSMLGAAEEAEPAYRAPMRTGYTDRLVGVSDFEERVNELARAEEAKREAEERERLRREAEEEARKRAEAEVVRRKQAAVTSERDRLEKQALERRRRAAEEERQRLAALDGDRDMFAEQEARRRAAEQDRRIEAEKPRMDTREAEARQRGEMEARRREEREAEALKKEREEAAKKNRPPEAPVAEKADEFVSAVVALRNQHRENPQGLRTCLQTLRTYIDNLARHPSDPKYQRINCENNAFRNRVAGIEGAVSVLKACGFEEGDGALVVNPGSVKTSRLFGALTKLDVVLKQIGSA